MRMLLIEWEMVHYGLFMPKSGSKSEDVCVLYLTQASKWCKLNLG